MKRGWVLGMLCCRELPRLLLWCDGTKIKKCKYGQLINCSIFTPITWTAYETYIGLALFDMLFVYRVLFYAAELFVLLNSSRKL